MARNNSLAYPTPDEMLSVLKVARQRSSRDWAMILLAYRHGMRASEVCGLELRDLGMRNGSITIRRLKGALTTIQPLYQHRGMPLLDETVALRAWLKERHQDGSTYVFTRRKVADCIGHSFSASSSRLLRPRGCRRTRGIPTA